MSNRAATVAEYLEGLPADRRTAIEAVRAVILQHLPEGFEEQMAFGMIGYVVPLERYPDTYNGQPLGIVSLASQKQQMTLYLMGIYSDEAEADWFRRRWAETGLPLRMGKSCVHFRTLDALPLDVVAEAVSRVDVEEFLARYERSRQR